MSLWSRAKRARFIVKCTLPRMNAGQAFGATLQPSRLPVDESEPGDLERWFDQHTDGPGVWKWRHYFPIYDRHLAKFVGEPVRVVEIGIFSGGSMPMWRDYFGDRAHIFGVDIEPACEAYATDGVDVWIGDQADPEFWARFLEEVPEFDVLIDDGGHQARQQIPTVEALLSHLAPGGVYVCEDLHRPTHQFHAYLHGLSLNLHTSATEGVTPFQQSIDSIHLYPFVAVIEMRSHRLDGLASEMHGTEWQPTVYPGLTSRTPQH